MTTTTPTKPSTGSINYLTDIVRKRDIVPGKDAAQCLADLTRWFATPRSQKEVSEMIDRNKNKPLRTAAPAWTPPAPKAWTAPTPIPEIVPSSKFAILTELLTEVPDAWKGQDYLFFEVKKMPRKSTRVINRLVGAPGKFKRSHLPAALRNELLGHLESEAFAYQAALTFAQIYQVCGRCAAELTDTDSRERKFGLRCWNLMAPYRAKALEEAAS